MKTIEARISYYVRKVAQRGAVNRAEKLPRKYTYRNERLQCYKRIMHRYIEEGGLIK